MDLDAARLAPKKADFSFIWDYKADEADELSGKAGEVVEGIAELEEWWLVRRGPAGPAAEVGIVPGNYLKAVGPPAPPKPSKPTEAASAGEAKTEKGESSKKREEVTSPLSAIAGFMGRGWGKKKGEDDAAEGGALDVPAGKTVDRPATDETGHVVPAAKLQRQASGRDSAPADTRRLAHWAHYCVYYGALCGLVFGAPSLGWITQPQREASEYAVLWTSLLATIGSPLLGVLEWYSWDRVPLLRGKGGWRTLTGFPYRGLLLTAFGGALMTQLSTIIAGFPFVLGGLLYVYAVVRGERCEGKQKAFKPAKGDEFAETRDLTVTQAVQAWFVRQFESGEVSKWIILVLYIAANLGHGINTLIFWSDAVSLQQRQYDACVDQLTKAFAPTFADRADAVAEAEKLCGDKPLSGYAPFAKTFGGLLNLNCALLVLPVARSLVRALNNLSCGPDLAVVHYLPLRKNVTFHKMLGRVVGVFSVLHVLFHWINFAISPRTTLATFPGRDDKAPWYGSVRLAPWYTGALICFAMLVMYPAAASPVKARLWEGFWGAHHFYILFFGALLFHGPVFYLWGCVPLTLFFLEKLYRMRQSSIPFLLYSVRWVDPVLELRFAPRDADRFQFVEGQFVWLNVPSLAAAEWHPFTISSAYGDLAQRRFVSLHIRVHPGGWTERLRDYLELMNPLQEYPFQLFRRNERGERVPGKLTGPDGLPLLRIDGPHAAPAQHYTSYQSVLLIGAGIGLTPSVSIIRSVLLYRWRMGFHPTQITFCLIVRQSEVAAFQWFLASLVELEAERAREVAGGNANPANFLEMHIFVTRVKKDAATPAVLDSAQIPPHLEPFARLTVGELMRVTFHPPKSVDEFTPIMSDADEMLAAAAAERDEESGGGKPGGVRLVTDGPAPPEPGTVEVAGPRAHAPYLPPGAAPEAPAGVPRSRLTGQPTGRAPMTGPRAGALAGTSSQTTITSPLAALAGAGAGAGGALVGGDDDDGAVSPGGDAVGDAVDAALAGGDDSEDDDGGGVGESVVAGSAEPRRVRVQFSADTDGSASGARFGKLPEERKSRGLSVFSRAVGRGGAVAAARDLRPAVANRLQDIYTWDGRPNWEPIFRRIRERSVAAHIKRIGVTFCGAPIIGKDLKTACRVHSSYAEGITFTLHKENF